MPTIIPEYQPPAGNPNVSSTIWLSDDYVVSADEILYSSGSLEVTISQSDVGRFDLTNYGMIWANGIPAYAALYSGKIVNHGTMASVAANRQIVAVGPGSQMQGLTNSGIIFASTTQASAFGIWDHAGMGTGTELDGGPAIVNSGTIAALSDAGATAIQRENGGAVVNLAGGKILAEGFWATGLDIERGRTNPQDNDPVEVFNAGLIEARSISPEMFSIAIYVRHSETERFVLVNEGTIRADYAIYLDIGHSPLQHSSETIENRDGGVIEGTIYLGWGDDIVINGGQIIGDVKLGYGDDTYNGTDGLLLGVVFGGDGDDTMIGGSGDDTFDGGAGNDTVYFSSSFDQYTIALEGDGVVISSASEGMDRLINVEFINFGGDIRSVPSLSGANTPPVFLPSELHFSTTQNTAVSFSVKASDFDGDMLTYVTENPLHGTVTGGAGGYFIYTPDSGYLGSDLVVITVSDGNGGSAVQNYAVNVSPAAPTPSDWNLLAQDDFTGAVGGSGGVFGTSAFQDITVLDRPGTVVLDVSFNRGGDIVRLPGNGSDWQVKILGSTAMFFRGETFVEIPAGPAGLALVFDDGVRLLEIDVRANDITIGSQSIGNTYAVIDATADNSPLPSGADPSATARLLLRPAAEVVVSGNLDIFGTRSHETIHLLSGKATLDASFNKGGDILILDPAAETFMVSAVGSNLFLDGADSEVQIPAGLTGMTIKFGASDYRDLRIDVDAGAITIGTQDVGLIAAPLEAFA